MRRTDKVMAGPLWSAGLIGAAFSLSGCSGDADQGKVPQSGGALEMAASERGLLGDQSAEPVGIFERRNGEGRDRICVVGGKDNGSDLGGRAWRFASELRAKDGGTCLTGGTIRVAEPKEEGGPRIWTLRFRGLVHCAVTALEQGDQLILPAHIPANCSALCAGRVDLAGAELDRTSWTQEEAQILRLRRADGRMETACAV